MIKAFVFGKFLPFHKGHEALIRFALTKCDFLSVLVCCSDKEKVEGTIRKAWIGSTFKDVPNMDVHILNYKESELPNTSESSEHVSQLWSVRFKEIFPDYSLVVTSEPYGDYVAAFMNIRHILFDRERKLIPISASQIRTNPSENWEFLAKASRHFFALKVVILGTESTGKSTLAERLSLHYQCNLVSEAGRELIPDSKEFCYEDLILVAKEHACRINNAAGGDHPLIIIDTDIHIIRSYSRFVFQKDLYVDDSVLKDNKAQLYLYLSNDVPFVQDGTRMNLEDRNGLDISHRMILKEAGVKFIEIGGGWNARFEHAVRCIDGLLARNNSELYAASGSS
ncbi:AAA family ATPase [Pararcticibacter amylolyticus]|uniref:Cytidyltransferase n=1 Tax=Pararcticibacter amylolyticus TaxID=2173175 RepID=A0A2U2PFV4_9SPHI|nr:AAA family ATPase [Pararcticibacter amylolyticus]PWG80288.1 cytidyltransferase [Pararcticibacter amylolyticus]